MNEPFFYASLKSAFGLLNEGVPPTPIVPFMDEHKLEPLYELLFGVVRGFGTPVGYKQEQNGKIIQHIVPNPKTEYSQISSSSKTILEYHTETAFHAYKPDYVMLFCMRSDPAAATTFCYIDDILEHIPTDCLYLLSSPMYETTVDESFRTNGEPDHAFKTSVLSVKNHEIQFCYDRSVMRGVNPAAQDALNLLSEVIDEHAQAVHLDAGDLLILNNSKVVHGRTPFQARYDGTDRWLLRMLIRKDVSDIPYELEYCPTTGYPIITKYI